MRNIEFYKDELCKMTFDQAWTFAREHGLSSKQIGTYGADAAFNMWLFEDYSAFTKAEREYILSVIEPFKNLVCYIEKTSFSTKSYINIVLDDQSVIAMPLIGKLKDSFKGMDDYTCYELEDITNENMDD